MTKNAKNIYKKISNDKILNDKKRFKIVFWRLID